MGKPKDLYVMTVVHIVKQCMCITFYSNVDILHVMTLEIIVISLLWQIRLRAKSTDIELKGKNISDGGTAQRSSSNYRVLCLGKEMATSGKSYPGWNLSLQNKVLEQSMMNLSGAYRLLLCVI